MKILNLNQRRWCQITLTKCKDFHRYGCKCVYDRCEYMFARLERCMSVKGHHPNRHMYMYHDGFASHYCYDERLCTWCNKNEKGHPNEWCNSYGVKQ